jgi:Ca-activated chloride channel family protein
LKKSADEAHTTSYHYQLVPEKAKTSEIDYVKALEDSRQGEVSKEMEELTHERDEKSETSSEEYITNSLLPRDEIQAQLKQTQKTDSDFSAPAEGPGDKKESGGVPIVSKIPIVGHLYSDRDFQDHGESADKEGVPILGDLPLVGGLYHTDVGKRPLTDEEKKQIVKYYLDARKSQPEGETVELGYEAIKLKHSNTRKVVDFIDTGFSGLPDTGDPVKMSIESLPQDQQIIVFGSKDQREKVRNMVREVDIPSEQTAVDRTSTLTVTGEDEPDLPPASRFKIMPVNPWVMAGRDSLSTFALDVDTASYTLCRRYIRGGFLPPTGAVRMEEFVNNFNYHYPQRTNPTFAVHAEAAPSPFARREQNLTLLKIGVKARTIGRDQRKAAHLIFVVDASASMDQPDRLLLVQRALSLLVNKLSAVDRVSLITCANEARLHLETIPARERDRIRQAINAIQPAGSTNLLAGLKLGYATARRTFAPKQINHVVLCSDGVANVGQTEAEAVLNEVAADRKQGITITCVGVGYGSYNDAFLEALANRGDGSYVFLDSAQQAQRVFVEQLAATLQTVARDARIQVNFNPQRVRRYRLIGYENRDIEDKRFRDDTIDAGEVGSGQCSTALYELELIGQPSVDRQEDLGTVFVRYRHVETGQMEEISSRMSSAIVRRRTVAGAPRLFLAAGAARFAEMLRQSEHAQRGNLRDVLRVVEQVSLALPLDRDVRELAELIRKAEHLPRSP